MSRNLKNILVTTPIESTWGKDEKIIFLGEWCKKFSRRHVLLNRHHSTLDYHWRDRVKLDKDHAYLFNLYEKVLRELSRSLNSFHSTNHSLRYWRIIVGPWLLNYLSVLFDRFSSISRLDDFDEEIFTYVSKQRESCRVPEDYNMSLKLFGDDNWNYTIFSEILQFKNNHNISLIRKDYFNQDVSTLPSVQKNFRVYVSNLATTIFDKITAFINSIFFQKKPNYIIYHSYFSRRFLAKLSILLGKLPRFHIEFDQKIIYSKKNRQDFHLKNFNTSDSFESFLALSIKNDIPIAYLESYKSILQTQKRLSDADVILTANAHFHCELFKSWAAEQTNQGAQLLISAHGGALYPKFSVFNHQEMISDTRIVWGKEWLPNQTRIAPNKLDFKVKKISKDGDISIILNTTPRYSIRCCSIPMSSLALDCYEQIKSFLRLLDRDILVNVKAKPKTVPKGHYDIGSRLISDFDPSIISPRKSIYDVIKHSRIVICTYPQTSFSEAIFSGVPTMLIYEEKFYEVQDIYHQLIDLLKLANIIHTTPESAAKHLKEIYQNPLEWWNHDDTLIAREKFNSMCLTDSLDSLKDWHGLLLHHNKSAYNA